jgi:hypothetical protein
MQPKQDTTLAALLVLNKMVLVLGRAAGYAKSTKEITSAKAD